MMVRSLAACLLLTACATGDDRKPPELPSSADQVSYAQRYPEQVDKVAQRLEQGQTDVEGRSAALGGYDEELQDPVDGKLAASVYQAADESGKSQAYAERARQNAMARAMLEENDGEILRRVAGSVQMTAQQKGCDPSLGGAASHAVKSALQQRSQDRLRETNRAFEIIERNRDAIGKRNAEVLDKQAEAIAEASYVANVQLPTERLELVRLMDENEQVRKTLDGEIADLKKRAAAEKEGTGTRRDLERRAADLEKARAQLDERQAADRQRLTQLETRIAETQKKYKTAFDELVASVEKREAPAQAQAAK